MEDSGGKNVKHVWQEHVYCIILCPFPKRVMHEVTSSINLGTMWSKGNDNANDILQ
jgi:hypothetical protein